MKRISLVIVLAVVVASVLVAEAPAPVTLKGAYQSAFAIGAAVNAAQFTGQDVRGAALVKAQFNSITPENALKWENIHPRLDSYDFDLADKYIGFGEQNHMFIVGHCLVWHNQIPGKVFRDEQGNLLARGKGRFVVVDTDHFARVNGSQSKAPV